MADRVETASLSNPSIESTDVQSQQLLQQPKQHRSRSFSALSGSSLLDLFSHRPRLFSKKKRPITGNASLGDSGGSGDSQRRLMVPSQIVVSELCVDRDGEEFEVTWTAFDASWPSGGNGGGGRRTRSTSNSPKSSPPLHNPLRIRSISSTTAEAPPSLAESTAFSFALSVGSHRRRDQSQEAFRRSGCSGRRNAVCVELDRRLSDSALSRFCEHAAIVDAMKQCF